MISTKQVFSRPSVAALAEVAAASGAAGATGTGPVVGPVEPTPIMRWFHRTHPVGPDHFNMSVRLELADTFQPEHLPAIARALVEHHDMLRLRVLPDGRRQIGRASCRERV